MNTEERKQGERPETERRRGKKERKESRGLQEMGEETIEVGFLASYTGIINTDVHNHPIEIQYKNKKHFHRTKE